MSARQEEINRDMLRVRDAIDREFGSELDLKAMAQLVHMSTDHLIRTFKSVFGETPHRYLQRRRIERAMHLLRTSDADVTEVCLAVGFNSLGTFSRTFGNIVGESPSEHRRRGPIPVAPGCFTMMWTRPSSLADPSISEKRGAATPD